MENTPKEFKDNKNERYLRGAIINKWATIFETYPDIPICQHMGAVLRSKGETQGKTLLKPNLWDNNKLMKRLEEYERELENSYLGDGEFSEDYEYISKYGK